jgi:TonB-dependent receptor
MNPLAGGIALALGATAISPVMAQDSDDEAGMMEEVVITGVRRSLTESMNVKRDSEGVVDAIIAEDIGKFPDTNLAEAMQRITGVSIDRSSGSLGAQGEGQKVTVRGVGPDFNLVLLNGRQMPTSSLFGTTITAGRSFDFSNIASESVSAVEVYKTSMSSIPTGGIGATINIATARPLDIGEQQMSFGAKAVVDTSEQGSNSWTPEFSGIYSNVFADGTFGITVSAVYQKRHYGYNQASTSSGWIPDNRLDDWQKLPAPGTPAAENFENLPSEEDLYSLPQNLLYNQIDAERKRFNGQVALQWAPTDNLIFTFDYTHSDLKIEQQGNDLSFWFIQCGGCLGGSFTDGPASSPLTWLENGVDRDFSSGASAAAWKTNLDSTGFNADWIVRDGLGFTLDYHHSKSKSQADSPYGVNSTIGVPGWYALAVGADYTEKFPVLSADLEGGGLDASRHQFSGAAFRNSLSEMKIDQLDLSGYFDINDTQSLDFGVNFIETKNRTAFVDNQYPEWAGIGTPEDIPDDVFTLRDVRSLFDDLPGSDNPNLFNQMFTYDFDTLAQLREQVTGQTSAALDDFTTDLRTRERTSAAYLQWRANFDIGNMNSTLRVGLRYEKTKVKSEALVPVPNYLEWVAANEYFIDFGDQAFSDDKGDYNNWLPNLDFNIAPRDDIILRASYSKTIGRQAWDDIQGGTTLDPLVRKNNGNATAGSPGLDPLESTNLDFSAEWYYAEGSYVSVGYFHKKVKNYVAVSTLEGTPFDIPHPGNGLWYDECNAATGSVDDQNAIRDCIFETYGDTQYVDVEAGTIQGVPGQDPAAIFLISTPLNQDTAKIDGWELAFQHLFGDSGFGVIANYTFVDSNIGYDDAATNNQFAILGLSDTANLVAFYDKNGWIGRVAWNWRDKFLSETQDGNGIANPVYTDSYSQLDAIVSYTFNNGITLFAEGFNLTDEYSNSFSRNENQVEYITQQGPRYGIGLRWTY